MRKIEVQMNNAITNGTDFRSANTNVVQADGIAVVLLHGNKIAEVGENFIQLFDGNHQTKTTKARLNAILAEHGVQGEYVFQKNFEWFVRTVQGVKAGDKEGFVTIPFYSGMRLN
jgi:hypothetical protein